MDEIDNDLMDEINISTRQDEQKVKHHQNQVEVRNVYKNRDQGIETIFKIINYCIDGAMVFMSFVMMDSYDEAYPLIFCLGLIIWLGYRMLSFKRNETINIIIGLFLFLATVGFYIWAFSDDYEEVVGKILIPTVYLGYFCAWGAIRRNGKGNDGYDK